LAQFFNLRSQNRITEIGTGDIYISKARSKSAPLKQHRSNQLWSSSPDRPSRCLNPLHAIRPVITAALKLPAQVSISKVS